jgi:hypothetical protein
MRNNRSSVTLLTAACTLALCALCATPSQAQQFTLPIYPQLTEPVADDLGGMSCLDSVVEEELNGGQSDPDALKDLFETGPSETGKDDEHRPDVKQPLPDNYPLDGDPLARATNEKQSFQWRAALSESYRFLLIMHAFRLGTEPSTRKDLRGPFFKDYFTSVRNLRGWRDGDEFLVNYIGHPIQGAVSGFIQIHNDPKGINQEVGINNKQYWVSRLKAMGWATISSLNFEIGPLSEASLGNVGLAPSKKSNHPMSYVDFVVTPVLGTAWLVGEDVLDRYLIRYIEDRTTNRAARALARCFLNPSRSFANMLRGKWFWHRDERSLKATSPIF